MGEKVNNTKSSFILYLNYEDKFDLLTDEQLGKLIREVLNYEKTQENPTKGKLDALTEMTFLFIKGDLDRSRVKYNASVENGKKGGRPKKDKPKKTQQSQIEPNTNLDVEVDVVDDVVVGVGVVGEVINNTSSTELKVISLTLNDKTEYPIFDNDIRKWSELYQDVDIIQELRNMKGWLDSNPKRRKTKSGISRFINSWLSREQDNPKIKKHVDNGKIDWSK